MTAIQEEPPAWSKWKWRCLLSLSLVVGLFVMGASLSHIGRAAGVLRDWPYAPAGRDIVVDVPAGTPIGWSRVTQVLPGGAADRAGVRPGDLLRTGRFALAPGEVLAPGVRTPLTIARNDQQLSTEIVAPKQPQLDPLGSLVLGSQGLAGLVSETLGIVLLVLRGRRNRAAAMLGILLQFLGWSAGGYGMLWAPTLAVAQLKEVLSGFAIAGICGFLPITGMEVSAPRRAPGEARSILVLSGLLATVVAAWSLASEIPMHLPTVGTPEGVLVAALLCFGTIARNYRRNDAAARNRIKIVLLAFACYIVSIGLFFWFIWSGQDPRLLWAIVGSALIGLAEPGFIAYAMLRRKLFDLNFAINRTLVYGAVSFTLLACFGLAEWAADRLVPESWHHESAIYSAGIALLLFLSFHRVRDWFEHHIERLFFHRWQENEAELKRFVASAAHFEQAPALCREFVTEVERFAQGAGAALYLRGEEGGYDLHCGAQPGAAERYAEDNRLFAAMRAERRPVEIAATHTVLPGALALPMLDQLGLAGFLLVGPRPDGAHYRPDEIDNLAWATQQVGLDLQGLQARELRNDVAELRQQLAGRAAKRRRAAAAPRLAVTN
jgi:hypothetical protein